MVNTANPSPATDTVSPQVENIVEGMSFSDFMKLFPRFNTILIQSINTEIIKQLNNIIKLMKKTDLSDCEERKEFCDELKDTAVFIIRKLKETSADDWNAISLSTQLMQNMELYYQSMENLGNRNYKLIYDIIKGINDKMVELYYLDYKKDDSIKDEVFRYIGSIIIDYLPRGFESDL